MSLSGPDGDVAISTDGPGISYLGLTDPSTGERRKWTHNLRFVQIESNMVITKVIINHIKGLLAIARNRYVEATDVNVMQMEPSDLSKWLAIGRQDVIGFAGMSMTLGYYVGDQPAEHDDG